MPKNKRKEKQSLKKKSTVETPFLSSPGENGHDQPTQREKKKKPDPVRRKEKKKKRKHNQRETPNSPSMEEIYKKNPSSQLIV